MSKTKVRVVTGCANRYPMVNRHGRHIAVGDRIRYQHCVGRYGTTALGETDVTEPHYPYGRIANAVFDLDFKANVLRGYRENHNWEHGHVTWVEVLPQQQT